MKIFIVYWHPEPASFNAAMLRTADKVLSAQGHEVQVSDLGAMAFDPVSGRHNFTTRCNPEYFCQRLEEAYAYDHKGFTADLETEMQKLEWCELLIFQFPLWWCSMPAMMKGWIDRVLAYKRVYTEEQTYSKGPFSNKKALLSLTTGDPESSYCSQGVHGDISELLKPLQQGVLGFLGFKVLEPFIAFGPGQLTEQVRIDLLDRFSARLRQIGYESPVQNSEQTTAAEA